MESSEKSNKANYVGRAIYQAVPLRIYINRKRHSGVLSADERELLCLQLNELIEFCDSQTDSLHKSDKTGTAVRNYYTISRAYFRLAFKVLRGKP